jgi:hypothetical protein
MIRRCPERLNGESEESSQVPNPPASHQRSTMTAIVRIIGREIIDSRGNPTVEVDVQLRTTHWTFRSS